MRRRALLSAAGSLLTVTLAGCTNEVSSGSTLGARAPTAQLRMQPVTTEELPSKVLYSISDSPGGDPEASLLDGLRNGSETAATEATREPLPENQSIAYDGTVYRLSYEVTAETPATHYSVIIDVVTDEVVEFEAIHFADLPETDRRQFAERGLDDGDPVGIGTGFLYTDAERDASVLVPDSEYSYIVWDDGAEAEWEVNDSYETTLNTYEYRSTDTRPAIEYGREMRERFAFELSDLTDAERDVVEAATDDGQYVVGPDETPADTFMSVTEQFRARSRVRPLDEEPEQIETQVGGTYLVQYEGTLYWTYLWVPEETTTSETTASRANGTDSSQSRH
ncbi:hypothetical protein [Haloprofundus halobius]|uniref:hypothetical protein n=1 Tax=Haloprofundus halobius TaxID=2876194 RepID=UPI001CCEC4F9|nr:hypothetical protein [Haloprofundus halobius]